MYWHGCSVLYCTVSAHCMASFHIHRLPRRAGTCCRGPLFWCATGGMATRALSLRGARRVICRAGVAPALLETGATRLTVFFCTITERERESGRGNDTVNESIAQSKTQHNTTHHSTAVTQHVGGASARCSLLSVHLSLTW
mgnify:CR=1 FL=1